MIIRQAQPKDLDFIIDCIIESEKSGGDIFPYSEAFGISILQFSQIIKGIFDEEIADQPWCLDHWYVVESDEGDAVAGLSAWIEGVGGVSSDMLKAQILNFFLKKEWEAATEKLQVLSSVSIPRKSQYVQLEHLFTHRLHRGKGYMKALMNYALDLYTDFPAEIQVLEINKNAVSLYEYIGFSVNERQCNEALERLSLLSGNCKLQLLKNHG
jgi:GNAT superfamily N-acetyltransferase